MLYRYEVYRDMRFLFEPRAYVLFLCMTASISFLLALTITNFKQYCGQYQLFGLLN